MIGKERDGDAAFRSFRSGGKEGEERWNCCCFLDCDLYLPLTGGQVTLKQRSHKSGTPWIVSESALCMAASSF